ncbi:hypothetical protein Sjap_003152 [Stephania japonica]|uniref:Glycine-rich protein n=1 Tax=Stephania japonica TaxID=461633 RepID=A0AAP0KQC1_9MAGN
MSTTRLLALLVLLSALVCSTNAIRNLVTKKGPLENEKHFFYDGGDVGFANGAGYGYGAGAGFGAGVGLGGLGAGLGGENGDGFGNGLP